MRLRAPSAQDAPRCPRVRRDPSLDGHVSHRPGVCCAWGSGPPWQQPQLTLPCRDAREPHPHHGQAGA